MMFLYKHKSKDCKQNTWEKHPWENSPGKFIDEDVPLKNIHQIKCNYLQISSGLT